MTTTQFGGLARNPRIAPGRIAKAPQSFAADTFRPTAVSTGQNTLFDIGSPANTTAYTYTFACADLPSTQTITVTTGGSATAAELAALISAAIDANSTLGGIIAVKAFENAGADLRITYHRGLAAVTVTATGSSTGVTITNTAAGAGTAATFGRFMALGDSASLGDNRTLAPLTAAAGPVITVTIVVDSNGDTFADVYATPDGATPVTAVNYTAVTDTATTVPVAVAAYEAAFPLATVTGVTGTGVITIALPVGVGVSPISATASGSSTISVSAVAGSAVPVVRMVLDPGDEVPASIGADVTATPVDGLILGLSSLHGEVGAEFDAAITFGGRVYVETADGANKGRPYVAPSPSRFALGANASDAHWIRQDEVDPTAALLYIGTI